MHLILGLPQNTECASLLLMIKLPTLSQSQKINECLSITNIYSSVLIFPYQRASVVHLGRIGMECTTVEPLLKDTSEMRKPP